MKTLSFFAISLSVAAFTAAAAPIILSMNSRKTEPASRVSGLVVSQQAGSFALSSNLSQLTQPGAIIGLPDPLTSTMWSGARFGTDSGAYWLNTVTLALELPSAVAVSLYSDSGGSPGQSLAVLPFAGQNCPQQNPGTICQMTFAGNGFALAANSNYWIVSSGGNGGWVFTTSLQGEGPGFQTIWARTLNAGGSWTVHASGPMMMSVTADVPEPGILGLLGIGFLSLRVCKSWLP